MTLHALTVLGRDRPGIIGETTAALAGLGLNLEDSTMTLLRGHFAMMLITAGDAGLEEIRAAVDPLNADDTLEVTVREILPGTQSTRGTPYLLSVHGADRAGIVSRVVGEVARVGGNITDLSTRLGGGLYVLAAECDLPEGCDVPALDTAIRSAASDLGVEASLRRLEADDL